MTKVRQIQVCITLAALALAVAHQVWPEWLLDKWTMYLIIIAVLPWLAPLFKSVELPGLKVHFQDLQEASQRADQAGLLAEESHQADEFAFQSVASRDPNLALAGLRIEIEKRVLELAQRYNTSTRRASFGQLLRAFIKLGIFTRQESSVLLDLIALLNSAVHGASVDEQSAQWAVDIGPRILATLDEKLNKRRPKREANN
ncbi:hypothetical protein ACFLS1_07775 [Verrucomicrobiota bacterium]